jgi:hypothetical protein
LRALEVNVGVAIEFGRMDESSAYLDESLLLVREFGDPVRLSNVFNLGANVALYAGNWDDAVVACKRGLALRADLPESNVGTLPSNLAFALAMKNDARRALAVCEETLDLQLRLADAQGVAYALVPTAQVTAPSNPERAAVLLHMSGELARSHGFTFARFELSAHQQASAMVAELIGGEVTDQEIADITPESAVELGRQAIEHARALADA